MLEQTANNINKWNQVQDVLHNDAPQEVPVAQPVSLPALPLARGLKASSGGNYSCSCGGTATACESIHAATGGDRVRVFRHECDDLSALRTTVQVARPTQATQ